jgi:ferric-dicitrate binding protein FerR (iron transport regulator)
MENESYYWDIIAKYLQGKASLNEQEELQAWRQADATHESQFKAQEKLWKLTEYSPDIQVDTVSAWNRTKSKIEEKSDDPRPIRKMIFSGIKVAASIAIVFGFIWVFKNHNAGEELITVKSGNKKIDFILPDSSHVWLNKESELVYNKDFSGTEREVKLEGEGFFEVTKNPKRPFIIRAEKVITKVLGTSFNLRNYASESSIDLAVSTGRVSFKAERGTDEAIVTPGNGASFHKAGERLTQYKLSNANSGAWRTGKLNFENIPLKQVLGDLERFYGIKVKLQNANLGNCRFSGNFENAKLDEVLQILEITLNLNYQKLSKHNIIITGPGCNN